MSEADDIEAQNISGAEDNEDKEAASVSGSRIEKKKSQTKRFIIVTSVMILVFSMIALGFAIFSTIQVIQKDENKSIDDLNVMANQLAVKMTEIVDANRNQSLVIESKMLDIRRLIQDNWQDFNQRRIPERMREVENAVDSTNSRVTEVENVFHFDSTNSRMKAVEDTLTIMNSRVSKMTDRVKKLEYPARDRRQGGEDPISVNDNTTALALGGGLQQTLHIEDFKI